MLTAQDEAELIATLDKLPHFDSAWPARVQRSWWKSYTGLMQEAERRDRITLTLPLAPYHYATLDMPRLLTEDEWQHLMAVLDAMRPALVEDEPQLPQPDIGEADRQRMDIAELAEETR